MDIMELGAIGELVGGIAVVVTLIYLVVQVRQNTDQLRQATEVARGTAELETAKMNMSYFAEYVRNPALLSIWARAYKDGPGSLTPDERAQWTASTAFWLHLTQGNYRQYRRGLLPQESWEPVERGLAGFMQQEVGRKWWDDEALNVAVLATDFRAHVEELETSFEDDAWMPPRASQLGTD